MKRLHLIVDGHALSGSVTGVGRYTSGLIRGLMGHGVSVRLIATPHTAATAPVRALADEGVTVVRRPAAMARGQRALCALGLPFPFISPWTHGHAVLFPNNRWMPAPNQLTCTVVYDLGFLTVPDAMNPAYSARLPRMISQAVKRSDLIITISHSIADELRHAYGISEDRLVVVPPGIDSAQEQPPRADVARLPRPGFILHVGTLEPRKNLHVLIEAHRRLPRDLAIRHPLVLVGGPGWESEDLHETIRRECDRVIWLSDVDDDTLARLYGAASLLAFPTRYEGFGLPLLEAMAAGLPVVCSDLAVLHEVGGEVPWFVPPDDVEAWSRRLQLLLENEHLRDAQIEAGIDRASRFSWAQSSRTLIDEICRRTT